ncbi:hypothetical protein PM082_018570 [Marasmius tenuissimus]|nr:hypothetical protein PM082_018570 [Marasmius tenuissimus]
MQFKATLLALTVGVTAVSAASTVNLERRITDPGNPANLINCPPGGGADACNLEKPCNRIRVNYGSTQGGHYIWYCALVVVSEHESTHESPRYNYDINNIPTGVEVGTEQSCTDY